ncbi:UNVERIFIED_CONTAM: hypothetical protein HDU68_010458 [Siphonaria sp. JEL0065]|nr:hypothetical protein HDU68_010458 [Siphonaria sp. JEL0065]
MDTYPLEYVLHHTPLLVADGLTAAAELNSTGPEAQLQRALVSRNSESVWESAGSKGFFHVATAVSSIRRQCSLDSRNSLFVFNALSTDQETRDFVAGLQKHLDEDAVNYYREHGRRVKRKKSKLPPLSFKPPPPPAALSIPNLIDIDESSNSSSSRSNLPLNNHGWAVRYDFKLAVFAEFRQDLESAAKHYEDAYKGLMDMFHATLGVGPEFGSGNGQELLQPWSQRWTEARVFADVISKICKLALYADTPLPALQQHYKHLNNFKCLPEFAGEFSGTAAALTIPGLRNFAAVVPGNGSFEYWAWHRCRVFGEIIEIATKIGLRVPYPPPGSTMALPTTIGGSATVSSNSLVNPATGVLEVPNAGTFGPNSSTITTLVVQHAGYYYYLAAGCTEERQARFKVADEAAKKRSLMMVPSETTSRSKSALKSLQTERTIDHTSKIIDLLTKSYEQFKRHKSGRMTLFLASEIARIYESGGRFDMALKFFERISKTYRKENWPAVLGVILGLSVGCAKRVEGRVGSVVEGLVELVSEHITPGKEERETIWNEFIAVLTGGPIVTDRFTTVVDMDRINGFVGCGVQFRKQNAYVRDGVRFQVTLFPQGGESGWLVEFTLSRVRVLFSNGRLDNLWMHEATDQPQPQKQGKLALVDFSKTVREVDPDGKPADTPTSGGKDKHVSVSRGDLNLVSGVKKVLEGQVVPTDSEDLKIVGVILYIEREAGTACLHYKIGERREDNSVRRKWCTVTEEGKLKFIGLDGHGELSTIRVIQRQPKLLLSLVDHVTPCLLDEVYPIALEISNEENEDLEGTVDLDFRNPMSLDNFDKTSQIAQDKSLLPPLHGGSTPLSSTSAASSSHHINLLDEPFTHNIPSSSKQNLTHNPDHAITRLSFGILKAKTKTCLRFHVRALKTPADRNLNVNVDFKMLHQHSLLDHEEEEEADVLVPSTAKDKASQYRFRKVEAFKIPCVKTFDCVFVSQPRSVLPLSHHKNNSGTDSWMVEGGLLSALNPGAELVKKNGWSLVGSLKAQAPFDLLIKDVQFVNNGLLPDGVKVDVKSVDLEHGLDTGDMRNYVFHMLVSLDALRQASEVVVGALAIDWRRKDAGAGQPNEWCRSILKIPAFDFAYPEIWTLVELPSQVKVGNPISLTYHIQNSSLTMLDINMIVEPSDAFTFAGLKSLQHMHLLPLSERVLRYVLIPLAAGNCRLPRVKLDDKTPGLVDEVVPTYVSGGGAVDDVMVYVWPA